MREIKFRGHDGCDWIYSKSIDYCELDDKYYMLTGEISDGEDAWTGVCYVGQYTGLKDKDGKEIYEGDIVRYFNKPIDELIRTVTFKYGAFGIEGWYKGTHIIFGNILDSQIEVIGNIYENPELLEN